MDATLSIGTKVRHMTYGRGIVIGFGRGEYGSFVEITYDRISKRGATLQHHPRDGALSIVRPRRARNACPLCNRALVDGGCDCRPCQEHALCGCPS